MILIPWSHVLSFQKKNSQLFLRVIKSYAQDLVSTPKYLIGSIGSMSSYASNTCMLVECIKSYGFYC